MYLYINLYLYINIYKFIYNVCIHVHIYNIFVCVHALVPRRESEDILWISSCLGTSTLTFTHLPLQQHQDFARVLGGWSPTCMSRVFSILS